MPTFHIIALFPETFESYLKESIIARAIRNKKIAVRFYNPRDFAEARGSSGYRQTDDRPYGGGPGMVMAAEPILKAVTAAKLQAKSDKPKVILFSPRGKQFTNALAARWAKGYRHLILICGRYEGVDARVKKILRAEEVSIGPYTLTGGELAALVCLDALARRLPGVLGKAESVEERRVASPDVYTRPEVLVWPPPRRGKGSRRYRVPKVLLSGHHRQISTWRQKQGITP